MKNLLTLASTIHRSSFENVPAAHDALNNNEFVILDSENGIFCGMNAVGGQIWELLATPKTLQEIFDILCAQYHFTNDTYKDDVIAFIKDMQNKKLITVSHK